MRRRVSFIANRIKRLSSRYHIATCDLQPSKTGRRKLAWKNLKIAFQIARRYIPSHVEETERKTRSRIIRKSSVWTVRGSASEGVGCGPRIVSEGVCAGVRRYRFGSGDVSRASATRTVGVIKPG